MKNSTERTRPSDALQLHRQEVLDLIRAGGGRNPRVFGSVARGVDTVDSDLDILVSVDPEFAWEFVSLSSKLRDLLGVSVDVVSERGLKPKHAGILEAAVPL